MSVTGNQIGGSAGSACFAVRLTALCCAVVLLAACTESAPSPNPVPTSTVAVESMPTVAPLPTTTLAPTATTTLTSVPTPTATAVPTPTPTPVYDSASDRAALVALYHATDGENWVNNTNWLSEEPIGNGSALPPTSMVEW